MDLISNQTFHDKVFLFVPKTKGNEGSKKLYLNKINKKILFSAQIENEHRCRKLLTFR